MKKEIVFDEHAYLKLATRCLKFNLDVFEAKEMVLFTIKREVLSKRKHKSRRYKTYCCYFNDNFNLSFYVVCDIKKFKIFVKTIIIEKGRE